MDEEIIEQKFQGTLSRDDYRNLLRAFDASVCDAIAVSQATAQRPETAAVGYSTHVFTRICAHSRAMICALPLSRWVRKDFETWDVSTVAAHARSILEGYLLFRYLADAPLDVDTQRAFINVMHLYDCLKRIKILPRILPESEIGEFRAQADEIISRLNEIPYFIKLDAKLKKDLLAGKYMMITSQRDVIKSAGLDPEEFDFYWNYLSQYTHVLSFTFYRMEENGRGTGLENGFDRDALGMVLQFCTNILIAAVDKMIDLFPDAIAARRGIDSKFSPGPSRNLPRYKKREKNR